MTGRRREEERRRPGDVALTPGEAGYSGWRSVSWAPTAGTTRKREHGLHPDIPPGAVVALDAGGGLAKLDRHLSPEDPRPVYIFLSHFHLDHIGGLHTLTKFNLPGGLTLCGPAGGRAVLRTFVNAPFTVPLDGLPYPVHLCELPGEAAALPFPSGPAPRPCGLTLGFRWNSTGGSSPTVPTRVLRKRRDPRPPGGSLITECAYKTGNLRKAGRT